MSSKLLLLLLQLSLTLLSLPLSLVSAFTMSSNPTARHPHCDLPGDPSLILQTNVDLGDKKAEIMKELSALVAKSLGKPESYVAISITDNASMLFGGSDAPLALGCLYSLGSINMENNGKVQAGVTDALEAFGVAENRIYINFFDVPRENVGWNRATFAG
mmetsp:Transcript_6184/g.13082  ORF Transcript_6184/g.13082 Transcript_6184/m.13082 type:complete len:160 (+) Transcript_6184:52-531(+)|eukprot:CAMPEP_0113381628 /NCGR_PEP_ID=MMETSP0013_2-20120614/5404_1 /TAXON_ID=2843 ORGANISM="Skeletonema costatum, Strain 1716" /NCGR_SAMPLE_ID=MMETSP0013_2 /ASSEMBLY_ACC=CAM_ASM_000158 /LENGTH=159 /DNA_ID=CAMNT_0000264069 /DNA_START=25 /DNA_END=504 /DNA_ORIENTATION=+ /assembly_acc=CAM_ASM_000158